jgi:hypothetical protein
MLCDPFLQLFFFLFFAKRVVAKVLTNPKYIDKRERENTRWRGPHQKLHQEEIYLKEGIPSKSPT